MKLGIPNFEVRHTLSSQWWKSLMQMEKGDFKSLVRIAERQIAEDDVRGLMDTLYGLTHFYKVANTLKDHLYGLLA